MALPYPTDPSLPANPAPLFSDSTAARGDHLRANNAEIWANFTEIVGTMLGNASISTDGTFAALSDLLFPSEKAVNTYLNSVIDALFPPGTSMDYAGITPPAKWMTEDGSSLLRSSYPVCWANLHSVIGTCTISIASPGVVSYTLHPFITGDCVHFTTTGALPMNIDPSKGYYVIYVDGNTFRLATTYANALAGTAINTGGTQSGVHTLVWSPWNIADATHFYIPDTRGLLVEGHGVQGYTSWASVNYMGRLGQYKQDQSQGFQIGSDNAGSNGTKTMYGYILDSEDGRNDYTSAPNYGALRSSIYKQGASRRLKAIDDGTNGTPRTGLITDGPRVGKNRIIRVL
jgi:hypothetical protein